MPIIVTSITAPPRRYPPEGVAVGLKKQNGKQLCGAGTRAAVASAARYGLVGSI